MSLPFEPPSHLPPHPTRHYFLNKDFKVIGLLPYNMIKANKCHLKKRKSRNQGCPPPNHAGTKQWVKHTKAYEY